MSASFNANAGSDLCRVMTVIGVVTHNGCGHMVRFLECRSNCRIVECRQGPLLASELVDRVAYKLQEELSI